MDGRGAICARGDSDGEREGVLRGSRPEGLVLFLPPCLFEYWEGVANKKGGLEWNNVSSTNNGLGERKPPIPASGFGGLSRRTGKKPVICAVNGLAFGGGCEIIINADMVIASKRARFALPEVKRGVVALAGGLTRLVRTVGRPRAMEMALTGRVVSVEEAETWGLVNEIVEDGEESEGVDDVMQRKVVKRAVEVALEIAGNSPDAVIVSREGLKLAWEGVGAEEGSRLLMDAWGKKLTDGENMKEGVLAFVEKRNPRWVPSKL